MNQASPLLIASVMATVFCALAAVPVFLALRSSERAKRLLQLTKASRRQAEEKPVAQGNPGMRLLLRVIHFVRTRLGLAQDEKLRQKLLSAGLRDAAAVDTYFAIRLIGPVLAVVAGTFMPQNTVFWIVALMGLAYLAPDGWVQHRARVRREHIRLGLPDALDLMVVCVDAGLGIDQALMRAGRELALSQPEISQEFSQINFEQRAGKPRIDAWQSMAERTELETVGSFVHMLAQTDRFGTPLVRALRVFADAVRQQRRQQAEELAAKTTVKLIFPLVLFIFPSIFIVMLGPAILLISKNMQGIFK
jgi:tight adherence protein C